MLLQDMYNVKKKLSCRLLILVLSFIVLFTVLLHYVGITTKVLFSIRSNAPTANCGNSKNRNENVLSATRGSSNHNWTYSRNYCNSKKRRVGSEYVLSYALFGNNSWDTYGKYVKNVAEHARKVPCIITGQFGCTMIYIQ